MGTIEIAGFRNKDKQLAAVLTGIVAATY